MDVFIPDHNTRSMEGTNLPYVSIIYLLLAILGFVIAAIFLMFKIWSSSKPKIRQADKKLQVEAKGFRLVLLNCKVQVVQTSNLFNAVILKSAIYCNCNLITVCNLTFLVA